ncbi:surface protein A, partial [Bifidobacterium pseudocatenulatum]|nr:surface protein A [Bifidobacterium pseudocatenulatum]
MMIMILRKKIIRSIAAITATLSMLALPIASANAEEIVSPPYSEYTGWVVQDGEHYWFDSGTMARLKEIYDPSSNAWYWLDADGTMARNKDVYQRSNGGKWVRYDSNGHMIKGEDYRYG